MRRRQIVKVIILRIKTILIASSSYSWTTDGHMDYFNDVLAMFLYVDHGYILAVYGRVRELSEFIKKILRVLRVWNNMRMSN